MRLTAVFGVRERKAGTDPPPAKPGRGYFTSQITQIALSLLGSNSIDLTEPLKSAVLTDTTKWHLKNEEIRMLNWKGELHYRQTSSRMITNSAEAL